MASIRHPKIKKFQILASWGGIGNLVDSWNQHFLMDGTCPNLPAQRAEAKLHSVEKTARMHRS